MSCFVGIFLLIFKPFGLSTLTGLLSIPILLGFGLVTFLVLLFTHMVIPRVFPNLFQTKSWTVWKEIIWSMTHISLIGLGNLFYFGWLSLTTVDWTALMNFQLYTLAVGMIPIVVMTLIRQPRSRTELKIVPVVEAPDTISLLGNNKDEMVKFSASQLVSLQSEGNYVRVVVAEGNKSKDRLMRVSLSAVEKQLEGQPNIFRVHRTVLINLSRVDSLRGSAQGGELTMQGLPTPLPVSRSRIQELRRLVDSRLTVSG
ncbi:MAG: LytR/AlgR family response regulator transcription factor [Calditrichia bacterium]